MLVVELELSELNDLHFSTVMHEFRMKKLPFVKILARILTKGTVKPCDPIHLVYVMSWYLEVKDKGHGQVDIERLVLWQFGQHGEKFIQKHEKFVQKQKVSRSKSGKKWFGLLPVDPLKDRPQVDDAL